MKRGVLIAIEGTDGSGKKTQTALLIKRLQRAGHKVAAFDFPRYGQPSAYFVEQYLRGAYGGVGVISGYQASFFYALDRFAAASAIRAALAAGKIVICDRYVGSNMAHQGAGISSPAARKKFYTWDKELEFQTFGIPKPTKSIVLRVPAAVAQKMAHGQQRNRSGLGKKELLAASLTHLRQAERAYIELSRLFPREFTLIDCVSKGELLNIPTVHELIWQQVQHLIK